VGLDGREQERLREQDWSELCPELAGRECVVADRHGPRTALRGDGDCVFLGEGNLCLVHKHLGYAAKPLGCRLYPFTLTAAPDGCRVGVRFSCPAVAQLRGQPLLELRREFESLAAALRPEASTVDPRASVPFNEQGHRVPWPDIATIDRVVDEVLGYTELTFGQRILVLDRLAGQLSQADMAKLSGSRLVELFELLVPAVAQETLADDPAEVDGLQMRLLSQFFGFVHSQAPREFLVSPLWSRLRTRWRLFRQRARFAVLAADLEWDALAQPISAADVWCAGALPLDPAGSDLLMTYLKTKLFSKVAMGESAGGLPYLSGLRLNVAYVAAAAWSAKARALARAAEQIDAEDVAAALELVDTAYFARPGLASPTAVGRRLVRRHPDAIASAAAMLVDGLGV